MSLEKTYALINLESTDNLGEKSPLHVTLTPPVQLSDEAAGSFVHSLENELASVRPFTIVGGEEDQFGPHETPVRVRKLVRSAEILDLHMRALHALADVTDAVDMTYVGKNYRPHSTYLGDYGLEEHETRLVRAVEVLRKFGGKWTSLAQISLEGEA